jgi:hypothetical protein
MMDEALYKEVCNDFFPAARKFAATKVYSITLGGSHGKGVSDAHSDFDFRIYYEAPVEPEKKRAVHEEIKQLVNKWKTKNIEVDGVWARTYAEIDEQIDLWFSGNGKALEYQWTMWGYHILTDIYNQIILEDPCGRAAQWKERLSVYPEAIKESIIKKHSASLKYWRNDYHYLNKVNRKDIVFLASVTARLIQDIIQIIYALNHFYYPGDGMNLIYSQQFKLKPDNFEERVAVILRRAESPNTYELQYNNMISLIDDTLSFL